MKKNELYIVATPIGNLKDITLRAIEILNSADIIAAEDTRRTQQLLSHLQISQKKLVSLHEHNEKSTASYLIQQLEQGLNIALVSDAGTPLISDPGAILVREVRQAGFNVVPIPGVSALITLLSVAGLETPEFTFLGFLPTKSKQRIEKLKLFYKKYDDTNLIFYEAPHRIIETIKDFQEVFHSTQMITFGRELTKQFESIHQCEIHEALDWLESSEYHQKGEFVVIVSPKPTEENKEPLLEELQVNLELSQWVEILTKHSNLSTKDIVKLTKTWCNVSKDKLYDYVLLHKNAE